MELPPFEHGTPRMPDQSTMSTLEWVIGGLGAIASAALAHVHLRINRVEDAMRANEAKAADDTLKGDKTLRDLLDERVRSDSEFRERVLREMVTKADMRDLANELRQSIRDLLGRTGPPAAHP